MAGRFNLKKELESLGDEEIAVVIVGARHYLKTNMEILSHMVNGQASDCVYVTLNRPFNNLSALLRKNNLNPDRFYFIDAISETTGGKMPEAENVIYISSPHGLTEISISLSKALQSLEGKKRFMFFDSISTLAIYNSPSTVTKFAHFLVGRARAMKIKGILISLEKETEESLIRQMSQFVDKIIFVDGN